MEYTNALKLTEFAKALAAFQDEVGAVSKDGINPFFKSKYATLENVIATVKPLLKKHGLAFAQFPDGDGLTTVIMHESGQYLGATANLELKGHTPQDQGSAITYMRRYALSAALGLATEDDDDGNAATVAAKATPIPPKQVADKRSVQKARIKELVDNKTLVEMTTGEDYKHYVKENTGLELEAGNYEMIIERLEALQ